jgi:predicted signal transduction protein with EAL and GGDEF domain
MPKSLSQQICGALDMPFDLPGAIAQISGSVGFAIFPQAGSSAEQLFERADYALYNAKQHLRGQPMIFSCAQDVFEAPARRNLERQIGFPLSHLTDHPASAAF